MDTGKKRERAIYIPYQPFLLRGDFFEGLLMNVMVDFAVGRARGVSKRDSNRIYLTYS